MITRGYYETNEEWLDNLLTYKGETLHRIEQLRDEANALEEYLYQVDDYISSVIKPIDEDGDDEL